MKKVLLPLFLLTSIISSGWSQYDLQITEIWSGNVDGEDLTADWFEITNMGDVAWSGTETLYYDDDSQDASTADEIMGISEIQPGESVIVVIGIEADANAFSTIWNPSYNMTDVKIGYTDGSGLGGGGDGVTLFVGGPTTETIVDFESYPEFTVNASYDVVLGAFSQEGAGTAQPGSNVAKATTALNDMNEPSIASPGNKGELVIDPNAPVIVANENGSVLLNIAAEGPSYISGAIGDPTDAAATVGVEFILSDANHATTALTIEATSDNQSVVEDIHLVFTGTEEIRILKITPTGVGFANIEITVTDPENMTDTYLISYAASAEAVNASSSRFHAGASDGSTAITVENDYMWVADDEGQIIRLYDKNNSGYPVNEVNLETEVGDDEIDLEGSYRNGSTIYWMGSHTETERSMVFSTTESGTGAATTLTYSGHYGDLREDLINWDVNNTHGLGANYFGLSAVLEIEALAIDPNNTGGALLALRAPLIDGEAIIIPVTNFEAIISTTPIANSATFGTPILLDLERHSFRSMECNEHGCLIIGGPVENVHDFRLFTWSGNANDTPELRAADLMAENSLGSFEGIAGLPAVDFMGSNGDAIEVKLIVDMGTFNYYNDGSEAKDLPYSEWKKFRSETVTMGVVEIPPVALPGDIVITEIMQNTAAVNDDAGEWFEIYNNSFVSIDLNGWIISDNGSNSHTIDNGGPLTIEPGEYLVLGVNTDNSTNGGLTVAYDYGSSSTFALGNSDDEIILKASDGMTIDSVAWDGGTLWPDPNGASMALQNPNLNNNDGTNWCTASTAYGSGDLGTPGAANDCPKPPSAALKITEIWSGNANGSNLTADWFEITNMGEIAWVSGSDPDLFYDDDSQDPAVADPIMGITDIQPGESVLIMVGTDADITTFVTLWSPDYDMTGVEVGYTDGAGLGAGGDAVTLFLGTPSAESITDHATYPAVSAGGSWDVVLGAFSTQGGGSEQPGSNIAVATTTTNGVEAAIGSPGNKGPLASVEYNLQITEIFSGQAGDDLTADWFEIENKGTTAWTASVDGNLYYDDESAAASDATLITGFETLEPGQAAIIVLGVEADAIAFHDIWSAVIDLDGVEIGYTDGAGLGGGGDVVTLWVGDPNASSPVASGSYPDTELNDGQSYDLELAAFSVPGNDNGAVTTIAMGGDLADIPNVGSPGNGLAISPVKGLMITEIFAGQAGDDLTADWFEIKNTGSEAWSSTDGLTLYYDDESASAEDADEIFGITEIAAGASIIVVIGSETDATTFYNAWSPDVDLDGIQIGYTDGAGLGGGGDAVTLWAGDPAAYKYVASGEYPDTELNDGQTYDVELGAFSTVGNANNAVATTALGGALSDVPNIGSPGNLGPVTAVSKNIKVGELLVYPNPSNGAFYVELPQGGTAQYISIYDITGQLMVEQTSGDTHINIAHLHDGIFFLHVKLNDGIHVVKITKK